MYPRRGIHSNTEQYRLDYTVDNTCAKDKDRGEYMT